MSLKVSTAILVEAMDGTTIISITKIDTVISPNPRDVTADPELAKARLGTLISELGEETGERLDEYGQAIVRMLS